MNKELTNDNKVLATVQDILVLVKNFSTKFDKELGSVRKDVGSIHKDIGSIRKEMADMRKETEKGFSDVRKEFSAVRSEAADTALSIRAEMQVGFMEIKEKMTTKEELATTKNELLTHIDQFVVLHKKVDDEVVSLHLRCGRIEHAVEIN